MTVLDAACGGNTHCGSLVPVPSGWNGACFGSTYTPGGENVCGVAGDCSLTAGTGQCNLSVNANALKVAGGSCTPSPQTPNVAPVSWGGAGEACGGAPTVATGCNAGQSCLPKPQTPFQKGVCIMKAGDSACPPGQFSQKHTFYTSTMDTRGCSTCACAGAAGGACSATIKMYTGSCTAMGTQIATLNVTTQAGACVNLSNQQVQARTATFSAVTGGACPPTGGQPTGTAIPDPTTATTFCCIP